MIPRDELESYLREIYFFDRENNRKNRFVVIDPVGEGLTSEVWILYDLMNDKNIVAKISRHVCGERETDKRFNREREVLRELYGHPYIVKLEDIRRDGKPNGEEITSIRLRDGYMHIIFMEKAKNNLQNVTLSIDDLINGFAMICDALYYAHNKGIYARDIKGSNLLVFENNIFKLGDFSEARKISPDLTGGIIKGTLNYIPPETINHPSRMENPSSDLYELAVTLWECMIPKNIDPNKRMLFVDGPIEDMSLNELLNYIANKKQDRKFIEKRINEIDTNLPHNFKYLKDVIRKAIDPDPAKRYQSAEEFKMDLVPLYREFNKVYQPLKKALSDVEFEFKNIGGGKFAVPTLESAKKIAEAKDELDSFVLRNNLAIYASSEEIKKISKDDLEKYLFIKRKEEELRNLEKILKNIKPKNEFLYEKMYSNREGKEKGVLIMYMDLMRKVKGAFKEFVPYHEDDMPNFVKLDKEERETVINGLAYQNLYHWKNLIKNKILTKEEVSNIKGRYLDLARIFCIL